jgi:hypothetical protein
MIAPERARRPVALGGANEHRRYLRGNEQHTGRDHHARSRRSAQPSEMRGGIDEKQRERAW